MRRPEEKLSVDFLHIEWWKERFAAAWSSQIQFIGRDFPKPMLSNALERFLPSQFKSLCFDPLFGFQKSRERVVVLSGDVPTTPSFRPALTAGRNLPIDAFSAQTSPPSLAIVASCHWEHCQQPSHPGTSSDAFWYDQIDQSGDLYDQARDHEECCLRLCKIVPCA